MDDEVTLQELQQLYRSEQEARARESLARLIAGAAEPERAPRGWLTWSPARGQA